MQNNVINNIQANIIRELFHHEELRFAEINVDKVPSDQFSYHIRQLLKYGFIEKTDKGTYCLSTFGKSRAIMIDPDGNSYIQQGFIAVRIVLKKVEDVQTYYLLQRREEVPYKGTIGTPGDKVFFGEDVVTAAKRIMKLHTGLECDMDIKGLVHIRDKFGINFVQDKYFFIIEASQPKGELFPRSIKGEHMWLTYDELESSGHSAPLGLDILNMAAQNTFKYQEAVYIANKY